MVNFKAEDSFLPGVLEGVVAPHLVTPGSELSQFIRAASAPPRPMPAAFNASYAVRALSEGVAFVLSGGSLLGGSSFSVTVRNSRGAVATCDRTDGFDGTYRVTCPHPGGRLAVHFYLTHVEFGAFVPFADGRVQTDLDHHLVSCVEPPGEPVEPGAGGLDEAWLHTRSAEPQLSPQRVPARTRPNDYPGDVFFVGASHMRFSYDAALQDLGVMQNHSGQAC